MRIDQAINIEDLHRMARRRFPKIAVDFIEGGLEVGARFVFMGLPTLYGAAAGGLEAIDILRGEIDLVMGHIGCPSLDRLDADFLWREDWPRNV
jgi:hypothetical protein